MITEDYIRQFEVAKLLKEKGFDEEIETLINPAGKIYFLDENSVEKTPHKTICNSKINTYSNDVSCPTHQMVLKWLREVHNIIIITNWTGYEGEFHWTIQNMKTGKFEDSVSTYNSFEVATEDAIEHCLKKWI